MTSLKSAYDQLKKSQPSRKASVGFAGYDNSRENIDPHIKTQVLSTREFGGNPVFRGGGLPYGELAIADNVTSQTIASATPTQLLNWDTSQSNNTTPDTTQGHITIIYPGIYLVNLSVAFSGDGSVEWTGGIYTNNGTNVYENLETHRKLGAGGDVGSASISGLASFSAGDTVEVWFQHLAGVNKDVLVKDCNLSIVQIGG